MTKTGWDRYDYEGRGLRRAFKRLSNDLKESKTIGERCEIVRAMTYAAMAKNSLLKLDYEDLRRRIAELETNLGIP